MIRMLVAAEDALGQRLAKDVADRVCLELEWVEAETLDSFREWIAFQGRPFLELKQVGSLAKQAGLRLRGKFDDASGADDALSMRKLFAVVGESGLPIEVLVVARDVDNTDRRVGFDQARADRPQPFAIVGALAQPESEAWLVGAWTARDADEQREHAKLRQELGFDPILRSHELTSTSDASKRDTKKVLVRLADSVAVAEARFRERPLAELEQTGAGNGLAAYLQELRPVIHERLGAR